MNVNPISNFDIEYFPKGVLSKAFLKISENAFGRDINIPLMIARGRLPGPVFCLNAALHGNELNGVPTILNLLPNLNLQTLKGTVLGVLVSNVPGFHRQQRKFSDGVDLNHSFPGKQNGNESEVYTYRLFKKLYSKIDVLFDLHTASFGRVNSFYIRADLTNPKTRNLAKLQRPQILLQDPPSDRTLRGFCKKKGIPALTLELRDPHRFQYDVVKKTIIGIKAALKELGMITGKSKVQDLPEPTLCGNSKWIYTNKGGLLEVFPKVNEHVAKGEKIAAISNIFGEMTQEYFSPHAGIVIGKSTNPVAQTGARIIHLGKVVDHLKL